MLLGPDGASLWMRIRGPGDQIVAEIASSRRAADTLDHTSADPDHVGGNDTGLPPPVGGLRLAGEHMRRRGRAPIIAEENVQSRITARRRKRRSVGSWRRDYSSALRTQKDLYFNGRR